MCGIIGVLLADKDQFVSRERLAAEDRTALVVPKRVGMFIGLPILTTDDYCCFSG